MLTACGSGSSHLGVAATVGDRTVTKQAIDDQVMQVRSDILALPVDQVQKVPSIQMLTTLAVHRIILDDILDAALEDKNLEVTDDEVSAFEQGVYAQYGQDSIVTQVITNNGVPKDQIHKFMRTVLIEQKLSALLTPDGDQQAQTDGLLKYLGDLSLKIGVDVNPRFGQWNPEILAPTGSDTILSTINPVDQQKAQTQQ
jgi:hypothetical protein